MTIGDVLERLDAILPERAPDLWASRRPPVSERDLDELRRAVDPYEVPEELVALLRWADGQEEDGPEWPSVHAGRLLGAASAAEHYTWLLQETDAAAWNPLWVPILRDGWAQAGLEMTTGRPGVVVDASFPDPECTVCAPSLVALLDVAADMLEREVDDPTALMDARPEWSAWPYDRVIAAEIGGWPPHWREAVGEPAESDLPRVEPRPIRAVDGRATIEGYVTERVMLDDKGHSVITVEDDSGSLRVLITPDTPGEHWAAWVDRRIQVDVLAGPEGHEAAAKVIRRRRRRRRNAPDGEIAIAHEVRLGLQTESAG